METTQEISLYSYLYLKQAKNAMFFLLFFMGFFLPQNHRTERQNRFCLEVRGMSRGEMAQITYIHVNKCKNDTC
jgi:hypothetical protein